MRVYLKKHLFGFQLKSSYGSEQGSLNGKFWLQFIDMVEEGYYKFQNSYVVIWTVDLIWKIKIRALFGLAKAKL